MQLTVDGVRADGEGATRAQRGQEGTLGLDCHPCGRVVDCPQQLERDHVSAGALDGDAALPHCRHELRGVELVGHQVGQLEDLERSHRHHDRTAIWHLGQASVDVAAQLDEVQIGSYRKQLRAAADGAGGHRGTHGEALQSGTDQCIGRVPAPAERADGEPELLGAGQVLGRMCGEVSATVEHGTLHLFHEHTLAADAVQRYVLATVAHRVDEDQLDDEAGMCRLERPSDRLGLRASLGAATRGDAQRAGPAGWASDHR